jgi:hypothetical protein
LPSSINKGSTYGATNLDHLIESVNEGWNCAEPFYGPRPQPDYSVGFGRSASTDDQLEKLRTSKGRLILHVDNGSNRDDPSQPLSGTDTAKHTSE